jgi:glycerophosphoryl diester phosphodiesterase
MKKILVVMAAVLLFSGSAGAEEYQCLRIGHRGARALSDENTLESLQLAVELGVDMLEFDVQRTKDAVFVLMHDETVDRTTNGTGRVDAMTVAEFKQLKTGRGYTPPTLEEVLVWLQGNQVGFIVDFKITDQDQARDLIALVERHQLLKRSIFESPVPAVAGMVEAMRPDIVTAIYPSNMLGMRYYLKKYHIDYASYLYYFANPIELALVPKDKKVMVWTVNKVGLIKAFKAMRVEGIMTDDPNIFKQAEAKH